jgi:arylsulfatase A-like enzyme
LLALDWSIQEAGMAQLDDIVGDVMKKLKGMGADENAIVVFTTDNGAENYRPEGGSPCSRYRLARRLPRAGASSQSRRFKGAPMTSALPG